MNEIVSFSPGDRYAKNLLFYRHDTLRQVPGSGQALSAVGGLRSSAEQLSRSAKSADASFALERLRRMEEFIATMDKAVSLFATLEDLKNNFWKLKGKK